MAANTTEAIRTGCAMDIGARADRRRMRPISRLGAEANRGMRLREQGEARAAAEYRCTRSMISTPACSTTAAATGGRPSILNSTARVSGSVRVCCPGASPAPRQHGIASVKMTSPGRGCSVSVEPKATNCSAPVAAATRYRRRASRWHVRLQAAGAAAKSSCRYRPGRDRGQLVAFSARRAMASIEERNSAASRRTPGRPRART